MDRRALPLTGIWNSKNPEHPRADFLQYVLDFDSIPIDRPRFLDHTLKLLKSSPSQKLSLIHI